MSQHIILSLAFAFLFTFRQASAQTINTLTIKKKKIIPEGQISLKDIYPDSALIAPVKVLSFTQYIVRWRSDPQQFKWESEYLNDFIIESYGYTVFVNIQVERVDGSTATLPTFYAHSPLERANFPNQQSLKKNYPDPNIRKMATEFTSYDLSIFAKDLENTLLSRRTITDDSHATNIYIDRNITYKFHNIKVELKDGRIISIDPFTIELN